MSNTSTRGRRKDSSVHSNSPSKQYDALITPVLSKVTSNIGKPSPRRAGSALSSNFMPEGTTIDDGQQAKEAVIVRGPLEEGENENMFTFSPKNDEEEG